LTGSDGVKRVLLERAVELGALEDAHITSRCIARRCGEVEAKRLCRVVKEVMEAVGV